MINPAQPQFLELGAKRFGLRCPRHRFALSGWNIKCGLKVIPDPVRRARAKAALQTPQSKARSSARKNWGWARMIKRLMRKAGAGLLGLAAAAVFLTGCSRTSRYNVLLITLDTTRADHLRCYGYQNIETPALNSLAREGVMFSRAYAPNPITLPAHATILSGTLPLYHGVYDNGGYIVPDQLILLPEVLKQHGFTTAGFISAAVLQKEFNLNQGFDYWDEQGIRPQPQMQMLVAERKADATTDAILNWLDKNRTRRWFIWAHYYDPHKEYDPPAPYKQLYFHDPYAGEIAFMDSQILRLFEYLKQNRLYEKTIIIAVADHGESLGEHQEPTHFVFLYEATQRIPLLIRIPGLKNDEHLIRNVVSQIDLMPTILDLLSIEVPKQCSGRSLKRLLYGKEPNEFKGEAFLESHFPYLHFGWSELYGLVTDRYKYIQAPKPELYELSWDAGESNNIAPGNEKLVKELDFKVEQLKKQSRSQLGAQAEAGAKLDDATKAQLLALGYLPGIGGLSPERARQKNPKDYADLLKPIIDVMNDMTMGRTQEMLPKLEKILERNPDNLLAIRLQANALFALGRYQEEIEWINRSFALTGESADLDSQAGMCYLRLAQPELARPFFERSLKLQPRDYMARYYLARMLLAAGKAEDALKLVEEGDMREEAIGHLFMAIYYKSQDRPGRAEAEYEMAIEKNPADPLAKLEYADFLVNKGDGPKALEMFEAAENLDSSLKLDAHVQKAKEQARKLAEKPK